MSQLSPNVIRANSSYNRRRAGNACLVCRSRKTKCDNQRPVCGFCAATGGECRYTDSNPSQFDRASLAILQRISQLESTLVKHIDSAVLPSQPTTRGSFEDVSSPSRNRPVDRSLDNSSGQIQIPFQRNEDLTSRDLLVDRPPSSEAILQASEMRIDSTLKWPIFSQAVKNLEEELQVSLLEFWAQSDNDLPPVRRRIGNTVSTIMGLDATVLNGLIENFLTNNHIKNPILDVSFLRIYAREFVETGPQWDGKSCLILLVCAVACVSAPLEQETIPAPSKNEERLLKAEAYFQASQRRIGMLYHQNSLEVAQCSFLTGVYLMATMQVLAAWKCFVQAGTQCVAWLTSQGKLKNADMNNVENDTRASYVAGSLYWSCLKSELELRFELGLPGSGINELDYPHVIPSPPPNIESNESSNQQPYGTPDWPSPYNPTDRHNLESGWFFYLAEIALKKIIHNVVSWLHKINPGDLFQGHQNSDMYLQAGIMEFETQIQEWYHALPSQLTFSMDWDQHTGNILRFILRGHMIDIREVVRFPALQIILSSPDYFSKDRYSPTSARLVQELLANAVDRIKANREGWYHRHQGTWLMARSTSRSALHLIGMALKCRQATVFGLASHDLETEILPSDWKDAVSSVVELLDYWADEAGDMKRLSRIFKQLIHSYENFGQEELSG